MASLLIMLVLTFVAVTVLVLAWEVRAPTTVRMALTRMARQPLDYKDDYLLCILTCICVFLTYPHFSAGLTVGLTTVIAGTIFFVVDAIWVERSIRTAFVGTNPVYVLINYGSVFLMAWIYVCAMYLLS